MSGDPYLDPRTGVFRNRLGLTDRTALAAAEKTLTTVRLDQLKRRRLPGKYDLEHLRVFLIGRSFKTSTRGRAG